MRDADGGQRTTGRRARIAELRQRLAYVLEENDRLQQELADERAKREELEAALAEVQRDDDTHWLFSWRRFLRIVETIIDRPILDRYGQPDSPRMEVALAQSEQVSEDVREKIQTVQERGEALRERIVATAR